MEFQAYGCSKILHVAKQPMPMKLIQHINNRNKRKKIHNDMKDVLC
jgi:hypothetical protein